MKTKITEIKNQRRRKINIKTTENNLLTRDFDGKIRALKENERSFILSFSSEEPYKRYFGVEILEHNESSIDIKRLNEIGCLLFNHNRNCVIGKVDKAWIENNKGYAQVTFDNDEESEKIYQKVKNGTLKGVSVGYSVDCWEEVRAGATSSNGKFKGPCNIATRWTPYEISIVSVPADSTIGIGRQIELPCNNLNYYERIIKLNENMTGGIFKNE